jgi:ubiquinone/menaquinone biosynthesis C-methylase UbiE
MTAKAHLTDYSFGADSDSLFDRFHWLYALCREYLFRDDTDQITKALWPELTPPAESQLLEIGCGPGFYSCRLATQFEQLQVIGVDCSRQQLRRAQLRAAEKRIK